MLNFSTNLAIDSSSVVENNPLVKFQGFNKSDFDAYQQKKWGSNVYNLERLAVKQKLTQLGQLLSETMDAIAGARLDHDVSTEHPAIWNQHKVKEQFLYFYREAEARQRISQLNSKGRSIESLVDQPAPWQNHLLLTLIINTDGIQIKLSLHPNAKVDYLNLEKIGDDYFEREKLLHRIHSLNEDFTVSYADKRIVPKDLSDDALVDLIKALKTSSLEIVRFWSKEEPLVEETAFIEHITNSLSALIPIYQQIAWSTDNDHIGMKDVVKEQEHKTKTKGLIKGDRVKVTGGLLSGKSGVILEALDKGEAKVQIGTLAMKIKTSALVKI